MNPAATVVVISHERHELRELAVQSVLVALKELDEPVPVMVIDSSQQSAQPPEPVHLIHCADRPSCIAKRRMAFDIVKTDWVIFLDDDCQVTPDGLRVMLDEIGSAGHERTAAMFVVTEFVGPRTLFFEAALRSDLMAGFDYANYGGDLMWGTTSLSAFRRSAVAGVRAFQEQEIPLSAGGEDVDACLRLRKAGWRLFGVKRTLALHDTRTWSSFQQNARRSRNYGAAESELVRLHPNHARIGYENLLVSMAVGGLAYWLATARTGRSPLALLLGSVAGWVAGELDELHARHGDAEPVQLAIQTAWSALYEWGRIRTAIRRGWPELMVKRFDWEAAEPDGLTLPPPPGVTSRLVLSGLAAITAGAVLDLCRLSLRRRR